MSFSLPDPLDICTYTQPYINEFIKRFTPTEQTILLPLLTNTCRSLANNEITLNEAFNFLAAFFSNLASNVDTQKLSRFANQTFVDYTKQWIPYQFGTLIGLIIVIIIFLSLSDYIDYKAAVLLAIGAAAFLATIAIVQLNEMNNFIQERESDFQTILSDTITHALSVSTPIGALAYVNASQLTINNNINQGLKTLTDPTKTTAINPPYQKLLMLNTITPASAAEPAIFPIVLTNDESGNFNIRFQNAIVLYIMNANPYNQGTFGDYILTTDPPDSGIINVLNAYSANVADNNFKANSSQAPAYRGNGALIYPGELKCFVNIGPKINLIGTEIGVAFDSWVEVTSDIRPFIQKLEFTANASLLPTHRIENLFVNSGITLTIDNDYAFDGQELILVANINGGSGNITIETSVSQSGFPVVMSNLEKLVLQYHKKDAVAGTGNWIIISGPN